MGQALCTLLWVLARADKKFFSFFQETPYIPVFAVLLLCHNLPNTPLSIPWLSVPREQRTEQRTGEKKREHEQSLGQLYGGVVRLLRINVQVEP